MEIAAAFADWQYDAYLTQELPQEFIEEFAGARDAGIAVGQPMLGRYLERGFSISSFATGNVGEDILYLLQAELGNTSSSLPHTRQYIQETGATIEEVVKMFLDGSKLLFGRRCSMWGAWGSRTNNTSLWTGRNLDWCADTGVSKYKTLSIFHITGKISYVAVGFAGLTGAITGMSNAGLTVHEAADDNKMETLEGFGWALRLRAIMENADDHLSAMTYWNSTNNTMGLNHGIGSSKDNAFIALETKATYTAQFGADDPREANYQVNGVQYGYPLPEALWRTNHGFDPVFLSTAMYTQPDPDTQNRYMLLHDSFVSYQSQNQLISDYQAVNITAVVGAKGGSTYDSFLTCDHASSGTNIISAVYLPSQKMMYVAFENGHASTHVPACCNYYVKIDMSKWF